MAADKEQKSKAELELEKALQDLISGNVLPTNDNKQATTKQSVEPAKRVAPAAPKEAEVKNEPQPGLQTGAIPMSNREIKQLVDALRKQVRDDQVIKQNMKKRIDALIQDVEVRNEFIAKAKNNLQILTAKNQELEKVKGEFATKFDGVKKDIETKAISVINEKNKIIEELNGKLEKLEASKEKEIADKVDQTKKVYEEKLTQAAQKVNDIVENSKKELELKAKAIIDERDQAIEKAKRIQAEYQEIREAYRAKVDDTKSYKERLGKELEEKNKYASQSLIEDLLMSLDQLDLIVNADVEDEKLKNYLQGFRIINTSIFRTLANYGLEELEVAEGMLFDPNIHEAKEVVTDMSKDNDEIVRVDKKGYTFKDKLIRPTLVIVNKK